MTPASVLGAVWRRREPLFAMLVLVGIVRAFFFFRTYDHLPQPFFYEPFDTWMDWFNTSYWAHTKGAYDAWATVYPPISFVVLKVLSKDSCYAQANGYSARECDWVGLASLHAIFFLNVLLLYLSFRKIDRTTALWRAVGLGLGLPSLFGLERGNLIVLCFTGVILGFGPLLPSARARWFAVAAAINFKVYIVAGLLPLLLRRRWRWVEGAAIMTVAVYLFSYGLLGEGTLPEIYANIRDFSGQYQAITFLDLWYTVTFAPLVSLLDGQYDMVSGLVGSHSVDVLLVVVPALTRGAQALVLLAAAATWTRPETVPPQRLVFFGLFIAMTSAEPGGYTENILLFFVFMERARGIGRTWAIIASYLLCLPFDIILSEVPPIVQESYLAGRQTFFQYYITVGPFLRPLLVLSLAVALSAVTLRDVWADIRAQGWRKRRRFRRDAPIMLAGGRV